VALAGASPASYRGGNGFPPRAPFLEGTRVSRAVALAAASPASPINRKTVWSLLVSAEPSLLGGSHTAGTRVCFPGRGPTGETRFPRFSFPRVLSSVELDPADPAAG